MLHGFFKTTTLSTLFCFTALHTQALEITINAAPDFSDGLALAAFERAATTWEGYFSDNITVNIDASFSSFGEGNNTVIGSTNAARLVGGYDLVTNLIKANADPDDQILAYLPSAAEASFSISSSGDSVDGSQITINRANLKALNYSDPGFDPNDAISDGSIAFNSDFAFDLDNSDGVAGNLIDFESVAFHEIGHLLGFTSSVDAFDQADGTTTPMVFDLFRFNANNVPTNNAEFTTTTRDLSPGVDSVFSDGTTSIALSTGVNLGDGRQASHFKDNQALGILDPTIGFGELGLVSPNDLHVLDLIGYDRVSNNQVAAVPEPSHSSLLALGLLSTLAVRRRRV